MQIGVRGQKISWVKINGAKLGIKSWNVAG
jgi:hypothetical protein